MAGFMTEAKFIVEELNKLLDKNYNMLTIDSVSRIEMLQIIGNVLHKLDVLDDPIMVDNENSDQAVLEILQALKKIKYVPKLDDPIEFRNGLAMANRNITLSLLFWLLSKKGHVKQRAYIARYVEKVTVPAEMRTDEQIAVLNVSYDALIQEFWKIHEINTNEKRNAAESKELQRDIHRMGNEMQNLSQLIQKQKEKVNNISNKEAFSVSVKSYLSETKNYKKLEIQLKDIQETLTTLESEIKNTRDVLNQTKMRKPANINPIVQISEQIHINKILTESKLPEEKAEVEDELQIYETVVFDPEPMQYDLDRLINLIDNITSDVKTLVEQKMAFSNTDSDKLAPFRNQATIISNKKQEVSTKVMEYKSDLDKLYETIEEKKQVLYSLVGGEVLHGEELKEFISKLRKRSILYKQYRSRLQTLTEEVSLLGRTYDILLLNEPSLPTMVQSTKENFELEVIHDLQEAKTKLRSLLQKLDVNKTDAAGTRTQLNTMRSVVQDLIETYNETVKEFEESTGFLTAKIEHTEESNENLQSEINKKEEKWNQIRMEVGKHEQTFLKLGEDFINSSGNQNTQTLPNLYEKLLAVQREREDLLTTQAADSNAIKNINELQLEIYRKLFVLLSSVWGLKNDS